MSFFISDSPKSAILKTPLLINILSDFRSLCIIPFNHKNYKAFKICTIIILAFFSVTINKNEILF